MHIYFTILLISELKYVKKKNFIKYGKQKYISLMMKSILINIIFLHFKLYHYNQMSNKKYIRK